MKKRQNKKRAEELILDEILYLLTSAYFGIMFVGFPLYIKEKYYEMAFVKWKYYLYVSLTFIILCVMVLLIRKLIARGYTKEKCEYIRWQSVEYAVLAYGIAVLVGFANCPDKRAAFMGTDSWYMGVVAQILFVLIFIVIAEIKIPWKTLVVTNCIGSGACFLIGILQRYGKDILALYWNMPDVIVRDNLSTIGNRSWYAGYASAVFPIGIYMFWQSGKSMQRIGYGVYTLLAFSALVTINSDSIYAAVFAVFFILFILSLKSVEKLARFGMIVSGWFLACLLMGALRYPFASVVRLLRGFSKIFLNVRIAAGGLVCSVLLTVVLWGMYKKNIQIRAQVCKRMQIGTLCVFVMVIAVGLTVIICNTIGVIQLPIESPLLKFNDAWGDDRGFAWRMTLKMFGEASIDKKIFGVGADCFALYGYSNPTYAAELQAFWGDIVLANAHNELLNILLCHGVAGCVAYISIFVIFIWQCANVFQSGEEQSVLPSIGLCAVGYLVNNLFGYQQICATGIIFILMGAACGIRRNDCSS